MGLKSVLIAGLMWSRSVHHGLAIQCFQCFLAERPFYIDAQAPSVKTCKNFDHSQPYVVDCPESTFCFKRTVEDRFYDTAYVRQERGCAPQLYTGLRQTNSLLWVPESRLIKGAYEAGCRPAKDFGLRSLKVTECYCEAGDLCNSTGQLATSWSWLGLLLSLTLIL